MTKNDLAIISSSKEINQVSGAKSTTVKARVAVHCKNGGVMTTPGCQILWCYYSTRVLQLHPSVGTTPAGC